MIFDKEITPKEYQENTKKVNFMGINDLNKKSKEESLEVIKKAYKLGLVNEETFQKALEITILSF